MSPEIFRRAGAAGREYGPRESPADLIVHLVSGMMFHGRLEKKEAAQGACSLAGGHSQLAKMAANMPDVMPRYSSYGEFHLFPLESRHRVAGHLSLQRHQGIL